MDDTTFAVAVLPPFLAIICELFNPVSEAALTLQGYQVVDDLGLVQPPDPMTPANAHEYYGHRTSIANSIGKMSAGAAEVSGVIPTFISVSTAAVATLHELPYPLVWLTVPFFLASTFAILASYCFSHISYFKIAALPFRWHFNSQWLSLCLIAFNLVLLIFCAAVWLYTRGGGAGSDKEVIDGKNEIRRNALAQVQQLNVQITALRDQLAEATTARDLEQPKGKEKDVQIDELGKKLNVALELDHYRSQFFGKLREIIGDRGDIRIVGDRLVFQSEVLFPLGSANLTEEARGQLYPVIRAFKEISGGIPIDIRWTLHVYGHADRRPIRTMRFASNWELSAARAISVVRYAISQGIPPDRLAASGFAENQPLDNRTTDDAYRHNRRVELKLTER
jgi:flagellar motor protein MotB